MRRQSRRKRSGNRIPELRRVGNPVDQPQQPAGKNTVQDDGTGDCENFAADSHHLSLFLIFDRGRGDRVGKSGDRNQGARACEFDDTRIKVQACEKNSETDQNQRTPGACGLRIHEKHGPAQMQDSLSQNTDRSACHKGLPHLKKEIVFGRNFIDILFIFFFCFFVLSTIHKIFLSVSNNP